MPRGSGTGMKIRDNMGSGQIEPFRPQVTRDTYHINPRLEDDFEGILATIKNIDKFGEVMGHRNYLFKGPPGTGKTLGVQFLATELGVPIYDAKSISSAQQVSQLFKQLRSITDGGKNKVFLMLDEVDKYSSRDDIVDPGQRSVLNQWLAEMDGVDSNNGIFIFAPTNKPDNVDNALRRPGRFAKEIEFMPPDKRGREVILSIHAYKKGHNFRIGVNDLEFVASRTFGYTGADLRGLLDEAFTSCALRYETGKQDSSIGKSGVERQGLENKVVPSKVNGVTEEGEWGVVTKEDFEKALKRTKPSALRDMPFREPHKKLDDLGGYPSHKDVMRRIFDREGGSMALFYGPPGTGKTDFAEALAGEYGFNYIVVCGSEPEDKFVGETGRKIDRYLERAKQLAPCVLVFDEMDALVEKKGIQSWKGSWTGLLQSKLSRPIEGVNIIGTMNRPDLINETFLQRFPHRLLFGFPTPEWQEEIWRKYLPKEINPMELVEVNDKLTGRDIANTALLVRDYGLDRSFEVYAHLIGDIKRSDVADYGAMSEKVGNSIRDYEKVKRFLITSEEKDES